MTTNPQLVTERKAPAYSDSIVFRGKTVLLQLQRAVVDFRDQAFVQHRTGAELLGKKVAATSRTKLWTENDPRERFLVAGKIHNLRLAIKKLDGLEVPAGATFSFWKQIGRASSFRGFVAGRELREGCIIPNVGGGICQLSNALYDAALQADFEILERHAHTQVIAGSLAEKGRDATVFWNYVDLRFRSSEAFRIEAKLNSEELIVQFKGEGRIARKPIQQIQRTVVHSHNPKSCATCEEGDCHGVVNAREHTDFGCTGFLVDEYSPEFDKHIAVTRRPNDRLLIPLDGGRYRKPNYAWTTHGFEKVRQRLWVTAKRSYRSRKLAAQGAARQRNLLRMYEELAESYAKSLTYDVTHVTVQQNLLPFLWRAGHLGGRTFDVLMSALPMYEIQKRLDVASSLHPESKTLGDFRADERLVKAEREALENAHAIVTPHTEIAALFPNRARLLEWLMPEAVIRCASHKSEKPVIVFPAATVGRKGCYELREAIVDLNVKLIVLGQLIEGPDFWKGFDIERGTENWLEVADLVVLPAFVEHRPRRLLLSAVSGVPVVATSACGVESIPNVTTVSAGASIALRESILDSIHREYGVNKNLSLPKATKIRFPLSKV
ncbi:MAG: VanW family protein [Pyrinomonadaceae bacterium]